MAINPLNLSEPSLFAEALNVETRLLKTAVLTEGEDIKYILWERSVELRPGTILRVSRTRNVAASGDTYRTELVCGKVVMALASMSNEGNAQWLLDNWKITINKALAKYSETSIAMKIDSPKNAEDFAKAILLNHREAKRKLT